MISGVATNKFFSIICSIQLLLFIGLFLLTFKNRFKDQDPYSDYVTIAIKYFNFMGFLGIFIRWEKIY